MAIPCVKFIDEAVLYYKESSCAFDFIESLLSRPNRLCHCLENDLSLIVFANNSDNKQICVSRDE